MTFPLRRLLAGTALLASLTLAACGGGGSGDSHGHEDTHIDTAGRLALIEPGSTSVRIYDLDAGAVEQTFALANVPSAIHASAGQRYALVVQRLQDLVQVVDGGIWQEDHVDHLHDYKEAPRLLAFNIQGARPTHYEAHDGVAAYFMDGHVDTARPAQAVVFRDEDIGAGQVLATLDLPLPMHGTAEPRGDYLLTTWIDPDATSTLPSQVELYRRQGNGHVFVQRFDEPCPGLHGSATNEDHTAFGCTDGVLVVTQAGDQFSARKIPNPPELPESVRVGTLAAHHGVARMVGMASPGHLLDIDPVAGTMTPIAWAEGRTRRAHRFDAHGENFLVLDDQGTLHLLDAQAGWAVRAALPVVATMPEQSPYPSIAASGAAEQAFVSDPVGRRVAVIDLASAQLDRWLDLDFGPTGMVWLGIGRHDHD